MQAICLVSWLALCAAVLGLIHWRLLRHDEVFGQPRGPRLPNYGKRNTLADLPVVRRTPAVGIRDLGRRHPAAPAARQSKDRLALVRLG